MPKHERVRGRVAGFTMIELMVVVTISTIVVVGLSALIEVPRRVVEEQNVGGISRADRAIAKMDEEIRYAREVTLLDAQTVEIVRQDGVNVTYHWSGIAGASLFRDVGGDDVEVLTRVNSLRMGVETRALPRTVDDRGATFSALDASSWSSFDIKSDYTVTDLVGSAPRANRGDGNGNGGSGLTAEIKKADFSVSIFSQAGVSFVARLDRGPGAAGSASKLTTRARRKGTADLLVRVYSASTRGVPNYLELVASGLVRNSQIPVSYADIEIGLTSHLRIREGEVYFVQFLSSGFGYAADVEYQYVDPPEAVNVAEQTFAVSSDAGVTFLFPNTIDATQAVFAFELSSATPHAVDVPSSVTLPVIVNLSMDVLTAGGSEALRTSFPILNNLARVAE